MSKLVADAILERLRLWGVHRIYGYPGDGINALLGALDRAEGDPEMIQVRHEEMAAFMACGHAKFSGEVGVCMATSGPGAIHLLNGLYDAKLDHQPVVAIVGQQAQTALGGSYQQEVDLVSLFKDVAHEYVEMASPSRADQASDRSRGPDRAGRADRHVRDRAERPGGRPGRRGTAPRARHGSFGSRLQPAQDRPERRGAPAGGGASERRRARGDARRTGRARRDRRGDRNGRAARCRSRQGAARPAVLPDDLPYVTGSIGLLGTQSELRADDRLRHAAHGRFELPVLRVPARGRRRRAACRSTSTRA